jgi:hypothetical protein
MKITGSRRLIFVLATALFFPLVMQSCVKRVSPQMRHVISDLKKKEGFQKTEVKSTETACAASVFPGGGQAYNEEYGKASFFFISSCLLFPYPIGAFDAYYTTKYLNAYYTIRANSSLAEGDEKLKKEIDEIISQKRPDQDYSPIIPFNADNEMLRVGFGPMSLKPMTPKWNSLFGPQGFTLWGLNVDYHPVKNIFVEAGAYGASDNQVMEHNYILVRSDLKLFRVFRLGGGYRFQLKKWFYPYVHGGIGKADMSFKMTDSYNEERSQAESFMPYVGGGFQLIDTTGIGLNAYINYHYLEPSFGKSGLLPMSGMTIGATIDYHLETENYDED